MSETEPKLIEGRAERVRFAATPGFAGRGPVFVTFLGNEYGPQEIDHPSSEDPNECCTLIRLDQGRFALVSFTLDQVEGLHPEHLPYLRHDGERYLVK
jgi:hypothetical protein